MGSDLQQVSDRTLWLVLGNGFLYQLRMDERLNAFIEDFKRKYKKMKEL